MRKDLSITTLSGTYLTYKNDTNELVVVAKQETLPAEKYEVNKVDTYYFKIGE